MAASHLVRPPAASPEAAGVFLSARVLMRAITAGIPLLLTACAGADADTSSRFLVLTLPASLLVLAIAAALCILAGVGIGVILAFLLLRAADTAASRYHRAVVASVLDTSRDLHNAVEGIVHHTRGRIDQLRAQLSQLREAQR